MKAIADWMTDDEAFQIMGYTIRQVMRTAGCHGIAALGDWSRTRNTLRARYVHPHS